MHRLDASDGHRDHTTWAGAQGDANGAHPGPGSHRAASSSARGWKLTDPSSGGDRPATRCSRRTLPRPPRPAPRIVTIAKRPSHRGGIHVNIILDREFCQVRRQRVPGSGAARGLAAWCATSRPGHGACNDGGYGATPRSTSHTRVRTPSPSRRRARCASHLRMTAPLREAALTNGHARHDAC